MENGREIRFYGRNILTFYILNLMEPGAKAGASILYTGKKNLAYSTCLGAQSRAVLAS
jgi:hypothetical protein